MTFKITLTRAPFAVEFAAGSIAEAISILQAEGSHLPKLFETLDSTALSSGTVASGTTEPETSTKAGKRGRPPKNADAPPPAPIPAENLVSPSADGLTPPPFLDRSNPDNVATGSSAINGVPTNAAPAGIPTAAAPPPPMPPAAAPSVAPPPVVPVGVLGGKMVDELKRRAAGAADGGQALADWLAACGLVIKGAKFAEALPVVQFLSDEKLAPAAAQLGIAA